MTTQRKIGHLLKSAGEGRAFHYLPELAVPFDLSAPIIVTEKVDGSTMQAFEGAPFKRYDNFKAGDPRKHGASEEERYRLERCSRDKPHEQHYLDAFDAFGDAFRALPLGVWVYFEAMGSKVQSRYPDLAPTVRAFDMWSETPGWWRWADTALACASAGLPVVVHEPREFGTLPRLLTAVASAESRDLKLPPHQLEGWVLRQGSLIAKIRKGDVSRIARGF